MILDLTVEEINYILNVLAQRPYIEVAKLIAEIKSQEGKHNEKPDTVQHD